MQGDITEQIGFDAVVNAASGELTARGEVAGTIHRAAGPGLEEETRLYAPIEPGEVVVTSGHGLPNRYVIHCVGPVYGRDEPAERLLASCYTNALREAEEHGVRTIAFPSISTGACGYPMPEAARIALDSVRVLAPALDRVRRVRFVLHDGAAFEIHARVLQDLVNEGVVEPVNPT